MRPLAMTTAPLPPTGPLAASRALDQHDLELQPKIQLQVALDVAATASASASARTVQLKVAAVKASGPSPRTYSGPTTVIPGEHGTAPADSEGPKLKRQRVTQAGGVEPAHATQPQAEAAPCVGSGLMGQAPSDHDSVLPVPVGSPASPPASLSGSAAAACPLPPGSGTVTPPAGWTRMQVWVPTGMGHGASGFQVGGHSVPGCDSTQAVTTGETQPLTMTGLGLSPSLGTTLAGPGA